MVVTPIRTKLASLIGVHFLPHKIHLSILPFSISGDVSVGRSFADGLVETLTKQLGDIAAGTPSLWVVPAEDLTRQRIVDARDAKRFFGANLALNGSYERSKQSQRITLRLLDTRTSELLGSLVIEYEGKSLTAFQDLILQKTVSLLNIDSNKLQTAVVAPVASTVPGADAFYLQARGFLQRFQDPKNIDTAISLFERAVKSDPTFALAYASLGEAYWRKYESDRDIKWSDLVIRSCDRAVKIDDHLSEAYVTMGLIYNGTSKFPMLDNAAVLRAFQASVAALDKVIVAEIQAPDPHGVIAEAAGHAFDAGVVVIAAAGNAPDTIASPTVARTVIGVGAYLAKMPPMTPHGPYNHIPGRRTKPDMIAPTGTLTANSESNTSLSVFFVQVEPRRTPQAELLY